MTSDLSQLIDGVVAELGERAHRDAPLGPLTTYRVGGSAALLVTVDDHGVLGRLASLTAEHEVPVLVVGKGSNLLVLDGGFAGVVVHLGDGFGRVDIDGTTVVAAGAAALPVVARRTAAAGLTGFEWAVGVPGSIGGAVRMNAGGHGSDMAASLRSIRVVDLLSGFDGEMLAPELDLGYRRSALRRSTVVTEATLDLAPGDVAECQAEIDQIVRWRREHQPGGANAGSVFTNPPDGSAGRLIDAAGCRGLRVGTAEVSTKHANFIQADPGGSADDVLALMDVVRARVRDEFGVDLHPETHIVGEVAR